MSDIERVMKLIDWLIFTKKVISRRQLSEIMGYKESYLSQILNGKVPVTEKFLKKLSIVDSSVNLNWLLTGEGEMLTTPSAIQAQPNDGDVITIPKEVWGVIKSQADSLQSRDKQIDDLIRLLREQMDEAKRGHVRREDNAGSADAV